MHFSSVSLCSTYWVKIFEHVVWIKSIVVWGFLFFFELLGFMLNEKLIFNKF